MGAHLKMSEVEETLKRISSDKGVIGTVIVNNEGVPIRSNLERSEQTAQYASCITEITNKARAVVRDLDPQVTALNSTCLDIGLGIEWCLQNDLTFLRIRSKKHEIMVAPGLSSQLRYALTVAADKEYLLVVIQN